MFPNGEALFLWLSQTDAEATQERKLFKEALERHKGGELTFPVALPDQCEDFEEFCDGSRPEEWEDIEQTVVGSPEEVVGLREFWRVQYDNRKPLNEEAAVLKYLCLMASRFNIKVVGIVEPDEHGPCLEWKKLRPWSMT